MQPSLPRRIVCLTEETTELLYLLGCSDRIVGISGFTVRPPRARKEKPKVSAFTSAKVDKILALKPDLVVGFSDIQADIARDLVAAGCNVFITNQRSIEEILSTMLSVSALVGEACAGLALVDRIRTELDEMRRSAARHPRRVRVYFEEWPDPMISGIRWVSELIELCGGHDVFESKSHSSLAKGRFVNNQEVIAADPELILASWCGRKVRPEQIAARPGWQDLAAVRNEQIVEIKSPIILQPGPASLTDGVNAVYAHVRAAAYAD